MWYALQIIVTEYIVLSIAAAVVFLLCLGSHLYTRKGKQTVRFGEVFGNICTVHLCILVWHQLGAIPWVLLARNYHSLPLSYG